MRNKIAAALARLIRKPGAGASVGPFISAGGLTAFAASVLLTATLSLAAAQDAKAAIKSYQIDPQPVSSALKAFAAQSDLQVIYTESDVGTARTEGVKGNLTPGAALSAILKATNLEYEITASNVVVVRKVESKKTSYSYGTQGDLKLAQSGQSTTAASTSVESPELPKLSEVVVTAQKRTERLQDVPVPVTALDAGMLAERAATRLQDYFTSVPGLSVASLGDFGGAAISIRGLTTGSGSPTVGIMIDDVPFGSSSGIGEGGRQYPDIDPSDLERVEVLRGPQGTLYGASSIGGVIKFVTVDPSTAGFSGRVQALGSSVDHGSQGYGVRGMVNVPLSETIAIRASAFTRRDPGYVDDILTGQNNINWTDVSGGRFSALWRPSEVFSIKLSSMLQKIDQNSMGIVQPSLGELEQEQIPGSDGYTQRTSDQMLNVTAKLGGLDFISNSGYVETRYSGAFQRTPNGNAPPSGYGKLANELYGVTGAIAYDNYDTKKFAQEFRLSSPATDQFEWLLGAFYTRESTWDDQLRVAANATTGAVAGEILDFYWPTVFSEYALFGDLTIHFTDRFDVQFGARESENRQSYHEADTGPSYTQLMGGDVYYPAKHTKENAFTYLVTPRFRISPDLMTYVRVASGYRAGGPNFGATDPRIPVGYKPDTTVNYEVGMKGDLFSQMFTFDMSLYYIDWKNVQISSLLTTSAGILTNVFVNGGRAKSQGAEISLVARPLQGLKMGLNLSWNDAQLTENFPPATIAAGSAGFSGDRLPYSARFTGSLDIEQQFPLTGAVTGFVGGTLSNLGDRKGLFQATPTRQDYPSYTKLDLRSGASFGSWTVDLFVNNLTDKRGILVAGLDVVPVQGSVVYIQPRLVGLSATKNF